MLDVMAVALLFVITIVSTIVVLIMFLFGAFG